MHILPARPGLATLAPAPQAPAPPAPPAPRSPSILLTLDGWLVGDLVGVEGRVSDALAGRSAIGLVTSDGYCEVDRDEVLAVVPPEQPERAELRVAKRCVPVTVDVPGVVSLRGNCHLLPGAGVWDAWQRSSSGFAALTEAELEFPDGSVETAEVILVSRHAAATGLRRC